MCTQASLEELQQRIAINLHFQPCCCSSGFARTTLQLRPSPEQEEENNSGISVPPSLRRLRLPPHLSQALVGPALPSTSSGISIQASWDQILSCSSLVLPSCFTTRCFALHTPKSRSCSLARAQNIAQPLNCTWIHAVSSMQVQ